MKNTESTSPDLEHLPKLEQAKVPREIWVLVVAAFIIALGYGLIAPLLPQFIVSFDVSMAAAGLVVSIFSVSRLIMAPGAGVLVDKIGTRAVYITGLLVVAVTTGLVAGAIEYWHIILLRALAGFGSAMFTVSAMGLIVKIAPPSIRGKCSAIYGTAFLIGNIVGPIVGAALSFLGFRWPFLIYGVGVALAALVVWIMMPRVKEGTEKDSSVKPPMKLREAWGDTAFRAALTSNFAHGWANMGVRVSVVPLFAAAFFNNGSAIAGFALAAYAFGTAVVLQVSGRLADTIGRRPLIIGGLTGTAVFVGVFGFADSPLILIILSALAGAAGGFTNPSQQAVIADVIGNERSGGQVLSAFQMAMDLGSIGGPIIVGMLADLYGFKIAFGVCGVLSLVGVIAWIFARESLENPKPILRRLPKA
ncbi:MFS transporter [Corynebacterium ammoniagenes]|uniref:MFS transporter n=1 Tax=Corynebacterium ammoniagenes TaxID=1697 RepID=UPI001459EE71|nr:MFS transporter [Corynebacterium ammoniagenes]NMF31431.1 MFS transporter [Corynebacterium ammoniagenes]